MHDYLEAPASGLIYGNFTENQLSLIRVSITARHSLPRVPLHVLVATAASAAGGP
jgi:hypothetical protein